MKGWQGIQVNVEVGHEVTFAEFCLTRNNSGDFHGQKTPQDYPIVEMRRLRSGEINKRVAHGPTASKSLHEPGNGPDLFLWFSPSHGRLKQSEMRWGGG